MLSEAAHGYSEKRVVQLGADDRVAGLIIISASLSDPDGWGQPRADSGRNEIESEEDPFTPCRSWRERTWVYLGPAGGEQDLEGAAGDGRI